jgi:hypothetical protein
MVCASVSPVDCLVAIGFYWFLWSCWRDSYPEGE